MLLMYKGIAVGDYLYIDGGEVSTNKTQKASGPSIASFRPEVPWSAPADTIFAGTVNSTLSISLATSWTSRSVEFRTIYKPKDAPHLNSPAAWRHPSVSSFYVYGGVTHTSPNHRHPQSSGSSQQTGQAAAHGSERPRN